HRQAIPFHQDVKTVPLADRLVGRYFRRDTGADFLRHLRIGSIAPDLAGPDRPTPDVDLALAAAAQVDAAVARVQDFHLVPLAVLHGLLAARQDHRPQPLGRLGGPAPVADQLEVAILLLGPQVLVLRVAFAVVVQPPILRLPVPLVPVFVLPAGQIDARVERPERLGLRGNLLRGRIGTWQLLDAQVAEVALTPLRLQTD